MSADTFYTRIPALGDFAEEGDPAHCSATGSGAATVLQVLLGFP